MAEGRIRVATIGAAFSANKGAASMLEAIVQNLPLELGPCDFEVLTTYPRDDRRELCADPHGSEIRIIPCRPWQLIVPMLPLALLVAVVKLFGGRGQWLCVTPALRSLAEADIVLDVAGISFADGRPIRFLIYNVLMTGIPLMVADKVVKCSQAMGPIREPLNRGASRLVLPHLSAVIARGRITESHLKRVGLKNVHRATDLAYTLDSTAGTLSGKTGSAADGSTVSVIPSSVVRSFCENQGIDYIGIMSEFIESLGSSGKRVLLLAHTARPDRPASHMNDLPLIKKIHANLGSEVCDLVDESLTPSALRELIAGTRLCVTARFHGLISALATATPALVVGWSHKYREALGDFELEEWLVRFDELSAATLENRFHRLWERYDSVQATILERLPNVVQDAGRNYSIIRGALFNEEGCE